MAGPKVLCMSKVPIFNHLTEEEMQEVAAVTRHQRFRKGEMIFLAEDELEQLFVLHTGKVKITRISEAGKEQVLRILEPGDFMGETALFTHTPLSSNAEAMEATEICLVKGSEFRKLLLKYPDIALKVLEEFSRKTEQTEQLVEQIGLHDTGQRVAAILVQLAEEQEPGGSQSIHLSVSKKDLASQIGTTRETLSRKLSAFQKQGLIEMEGQRTVRILNRTGLQAILAQQEG